MANIPIYDGNPTWDPNATSLGYYNDDIDFQVDAVRAAKFCASRLGYPLVDVELQSSSFFTAFEQAITTYGNELYSSIMVDSQLTLEGSDVFDGSNEINEALITPSFEPIVRLTEQYGAEAGAGGNVPYHTGSIPLTASVQDYDLKEWAISQSIEGDIEIKRVFYEPGPAITRFYDPYVGTGFGSQNLFDSMGFGGMSPAINFMMMPMSFDLQTLQAIELNDQIRRSNYSFELKDNKLKIFPIPQQTRSFVRFEYIKRNERIAGSIDRSGDKVTNVSNSPFVNPTYSKINSVGRQWIFEYTLAVAKEMLGLVRGKYSTIPIPNSEVTLNQSDLITQGTNEKNALIERLRDYFDATSHKSLLERRSQETEFKQAELRQVPYTIYIG